MNTRQLPVIALALLTAGCATLDHQTTETEPHALVYFVTPLDSSADLTVITRFDGLPVKTGRDYRVSPGEHRLTLRVSTFESASYTPLQFGSGLSSGPSTEITVSPTGKLDAGGGTPFDAGMQPVNIRVESRELRYATNAITLEAGWRYELDAGTQRRTPFNDTRR